VRDFSSRPRPQGMTRGEVAVIGAAGLILAWSLYTAGRAWAEHRQVRASVEQARREAEAVRARTQAYESQRDPNQLLATQALLTAEAPPPRVVGELSLLLPADVRLESLNLTYGRRLELEMGVSARAASSYDLFLDRLEQSPLFTDVLPGDENRDGELRARVRATYRGAGL